MNRVKLSELEDVIFQCGKITKEHFIVGYTTQTKLSIDNKKFEVLGFEKNYVKVVEMGNNAIYISEEKLVELFLVKYIKSIQDGSIYEHGYPESRLIPSDFKEKCEEGLFNEIMEEFKDIAKDILEYYI